MRFAAIDFETANYQADSACQVGVVLVDDSKISHEQSWLIRPPRIYFSEKCIAVHGIRPQDVLNAPSWKEVWRELYGLLQDRVIFAHNAMFDMNVLLQSILGIEELAPHLEFQCTRLIARRAWPGRSGYGLKPTASALGITFKHHDALEDARACAMIAIAASELGQVTTIDQLERHLSIARGHIEYATRLGPRSINRKKEIGRLGCGSIDVRNSLNAS